MRPCPFSRLLSQTIRLCVVSVSLTSLGCVTFHSPKVLEKGEQAVIIAGELFAPLGASDAGLIPYPATASVGGEIVFRTHVLNRMDIGLQLSVPSLLLMADVRYQLGERPPYYIAVGVGVGANLLSIAQSLAANGPSTLFVQAEIIGGTQSIYAGLRPILIIGGAEGDGVPSFPILPFVLAGVSAGQRVRFVAEASLLPLVLFSDGGGAPLPPLLTAGIGLMFRF